MTKENSKRLYDHYVEIGYDKAAKNLLTKYPEFKNEDVQSGDDRGEVDSKGNTRKKK